MSPALDGGLDLGIVVVSYNTRALLARCLESLGNELLSLGWLDGGAEANSPDAVESAGARFEAWVVDNGSADGSADMVAAHYPWVRLHRAERNLGFTAGNNHVLHGWSTGMGCPAAALLLNPDAELQPGALHTLLSTLEDRPTLGALGPRLIYADGSFQHAAFREPGIVQAALDLWPIPRLQESVVNGRYPRSAYEGLEPFEVDFVLGACMLIRGEALRRVGALDEGFFMYCEEVDWCRRARADGWHMACVPQAVVLHHAGASSEQFSGPSFVELWRSRLRYADKHYSAWRRRLYRGVVRIGLRRRMVATASVSPGDGLDREALQERRAAYQAIWQPRGADRASRPSEEEAG